MTRTETHICLALGFLVMLAVAMSLLGVDGAEQHVAAAGELARLG